MEDGDLKASGTSSHETTAPHDEQLTWAARAVTVGGSAGPVSERTSGAPQQKHGEPTSSAITQAVRVSPAGRARLFSISLTAASSGLVDYTSPTSQ